jgi:hypothetical protein
MTTALYDPGALLVPLGSVITTSTTYTGVKVFPRQLSTTAVVLHVTAVTATGTYSAALEVSDIQGGTYTRILTLPVRASSPGVYHGGLQGNLAQCYDADSLWLRLVVTLGGASPSLTFGCWLTKPTTGFGLATRGYGEIVVVP